MKKFDERPLSHSEDSRPLREPAGKTHPSRGGALQEKPVRPAGHMPMLAGGSMMLLAAALFLAGYLPRRQRDTALAEEAKQEAERLPVVAVVQVKRSPGTSELLLPGNTQAMTESPILARADGYLRRRLADIGDRVQAGQLLAEIEAPELDQQVMQAQAALQQAQAALGQAEAGLAQARANEQLAAVTASRWKLLEQRGVVSHQESDQQQANYKALSANVNASRAGVAASKQNIAAAEANLKRLLELQGYEKVRAPFSGVITLRNIDVGSLISAGNTVLFRIAQIEALRTFINVPQANAPMVHVGDRATLLFQEFPRREFAGRITRTSNSLDPNTRTLLAEVQVANAQHLLLPGMYTQVRIAAPRSDPPLLIPGDALVVRANGTKVALLQGGQKVHYQDVEVGRDYGTEMEILRGLQGGEFVIVNPTDDVREGARVKPTEYKARSATDSGKSNR